MKYEVFWKNPGYKIRSPLRKNIECDYLIVGGGVVGVSLAYFLNKLGAKSTVLIEKKTIASGATGMAAGSLSPHSEYDLKDLIRVHGEKRAKSYWDTATGGISQIRDLISKERIQCDAEIDSTIYGAYFYKTYNNILEEYVAQQRLGIKTKLLVGKELMKEVNTPLFSHAIFARNQALSVNPLKLTQNLSKKIEERGVGIYENTALMSVKKNKAITPHGNISFKNIIYCIDAAHPSKKVKVLKTTVLVTQPITLHQLKKMNMVKKKIIWDSKSNYNYLKLTKENRILIGFGGIEVDKKHGKNNLHFPHIEQMEIFLEKLFPYIKFRKDYVWSGTFGFTESLHPLIEHKGNSWWIAGAGAQNISFMAAEHVAHKLFHKSSRLDKFFEEVT